MDSDLQSASKDRLPSSRSEMINIFMKKDYHKEFIERSSTKFNNKFDYGHVNYINAGTKVKIICPEHGEFMMPPFSHLNSIHGCKKCGTDAMAEIQKMRTLAKFNESIKEDKRYDFSLAKFDKIHDKIMVGCPDHGYYFITVDHHLRGVRCKKCADLRKTGGYSENWFMVDEDRKNIPGTLYILRMFNEEEEFLKIGITKNTVQKRYLGSRYQYDIIRLHFDSLYACYQLEKLIKLKFNAQLYSNSQNLYTTESFKLEILPDVLSIIS